MKYQYMIPILLSCLLTACLSPVNNKPRSTYVVDSLPGDVAKSRKGAGVLLVLSPNARPIYQTTRMAYTARPYEVQYFSENQWAETPSQMLLPLLAETMEATYRFKGVMTPPYSGQYQYVLNTQILSFEQDNVHQPDSFKMAVQANLTKSNNQLVATKTFSIRVPLSQPTPYGGVLAANKAAKKILADLSSFVVQYT